MEKSIILEKTVQLKKVFLLLNPLMALCRILPKKIILWLEINGCMWKRINGIILITVAGEWTDGFRLMKNTIIVILKKES